MNGEADNSCMYVYMHLVFKELKINVVPSANKTYEGHKCVPNPTLCLRLSGMHVFYLKNRIIFK